MTQYIESLPAIIHRHRKAKRMTMRKLANAVGVTGATIGNWESGRTIPSPERATALAEALGLAPQLFAEQMESAHSKVKKKTIRNPRPYPQEDADEQVGWRICEARNRAGIPQWRVAKNIGVTQPQLSAWERGYSPCPSDRLAQIADLCGVSVAYLRGEVA